MRSATPIVRAWVLAVQHHMTAGQVAPAICVIERENERAASETISRTRA